MKTPTAYEWHNPTTGHCYVDYIPHPNQDEKDGYTKTPLFKQAKRKRKEYSSIKICLGCGGFAHGNPRHDISI